MPHCLQMKRKHLITIKTLEHVGEQTKQSMKSFKCICIWFCLLADPPPSLLHDIKSRKALCKVFFPIFHEQIIFFSFPYPSFLYQTNLYSSIFWFVVPELYYKTENLYNGHTSPASQLWHQLASKMSAASHHA